MEGGSFDDLLEVLDVGFLGISENTHKVGGIYHPGSDGVVEADGWVHEASHWLLGDWGAKVLPV